MTGDVRNEVRGVIASGDLALADLGMPGQEIARRLAARLLPLAADGPAREMAEQLVAMTAALATWETRDDTKAKPGVRQAANTAMDAIDALLRLLHEARGRLISEMRVSDDATAARVDALLAEAARQRQGGA